MNFDDIKDQLRDRWLEIQGQLENSPAFNSLKERYETLSPTVQKSIIWAGIGFVCLMLFSCPYGFWTNSNQNLVQYEENRQMIRSLLRASRIANQMGNMPQAIDMAKLTNDVRFQLTDLRLLPEQIGPISETETKGFGAPLAPSTIQQEGLSISLMKLNLKQVSEVAYRLQGLHESVKLAGMDIKATTEDNHYYNVVYRLIKFSLPSVAEAEETEAPRGGGAVGRGRRTNTEDSDE